MKILKESTVDLGCNEVKCSELITKVLLQTRLYTTCIISFNVNSNVVLKTHEANSRPM